MSFDEQKKNEELLRFRSGLDGDVLEALAELSGVALFNLNLKTGEIALNHNTTRLTGYEPGDLPHTGNTKEMLTFEEDRPRIRQNMQQLIDGDADTYQIEYRMRRKDTSIVAVSESALVYKRDQDGFPEGIAGMSLDLSRLRWAEEKARRMEQENRRLAAHQSDGELADQNRMLRAANAAAAMIIGGFHQDYETVLRQSLQIISESVLADNVYIWRNTEKDGKICGFLRAHWGKEVAFGTQRSEKLYDYDEVFPDWKTLFNDQFSIREWADRLPGRILEFIGISADPRRCVMLVPLYLHGEFWGMLGFDSTTRDRVFNVDETEIMASGVLVIASSISRNETFSKLNEARDQAMASTRAKGEFLSRMSHEIRTPMNAIIGMTTIAKKANDTEKIRYCLEKVDASSRQLLSIINDVLDMSKIDSGKFEIVHGEFDFEKMLQNVVNVSQVKIEEKAQNFQIDFENILTRAMISDELRLSQVLINLLSNAIKFTPEEGKIVLKIKHTPLDEDHSILRAEVIDNGIGISEEQQKHLFQSFEQADGSITRQFGGTGLGLAICKKIINLLGGDIWIESELGKGSKFIFEIQVGWGEKLLASSVAGSMPGKMRILVVDDAQDVREYFQNILGSFSLECETASGGKKAVDLVAKSLRENNPYQMIFIDWNMPGMNGGETATEIRKIASDDPVIVMISVSDWTDIERDAKEYGVTDFLPKPILPSMLYNAIVKLSDNSLIRETRTDGDISYNWEGKTILLAEDIEINREIVGSILDETGVTLVNACDGEQAVTFFSNEPDRFDLILMDIQMPVLDGLSATREIRALPFDYAKKIPILAMTANAFKEDAQLCLDAGMNGHLAKPLDVEELFLVLAQYLND